MDRYIGLDAHASSCTLGVVSPSGKRLGHQVVETNAQALVGAIRAIAGRRHLCLEEGTLSGWLYEVLSPHVAELVVAGVSESPPDPSRCPARLGRDTAPGVVNIIGCVPERGLRRRILLELHRGDGVRRQ